MRGHGKSQSCFIRPFVNASDERPNSSECCDFSASFPLSKLAPCVRARHVGTQIIHVNSVLTKKGQYILCRRNKDSRFPIFQTSLQRGKTSSSSAVSGKLALMKSSIDRRDPQIFGRCSQCKRFLAIFFVGVTVFCGSKSVFSVE